MDSIELHNDDSRYHIDVSVKTAYIDAQSDPDANRFVFSYTITIANDGSEAAKLLSRHWYITDANNEVQEVVGEGVVGEQPYLKPGETFEYTSGTILETPVGSMHGSYQMVADDGTAFDADIPAFGLSQPNVLN